MTVYGLQIVGDVFCALVAALHIRIFMLESIQWTQVAHKVFGIPQSVVETSAILAANQGFYNLILSAGLIWSLAEQNVNDKIFFLAAVLCAGGFGGGSSGIRLLIIQGVPSLIGLFFINFGYKDVDEWSSFRHPVYTLIICVGAAIISYAMGVWVKQRDQARIATTKVSVDLQS